MDVLSYTTRDEAGKYHIDSEALYPAMLDVMREIRANQELPEWLPTFYPGQIHPIPSDYVPRIRRLPDGAIDAARQTIVDDDGSVLPTVTAEARATRGEALELARLLFTELLHMKHGGGEMRTKWLKCLTYKL